MEDTFVILVIEDDTNTLLLVQNALRAPQTQIYKAKNSEDGLQLISNIMPHVILMDLLLPSSGMSGTEAIQYIRQHPAYSHIPIIAITAGGYEVAERAIQAGCNHYLMKPFTTHDLRQAVNQYRP